MCGGCQGFGQQCGCDGLCDSLSDLCAMFATTGERASEESPDEASAATVLSSVHGRQRRMERKIGKAELQAAVKCGQKEPSFPDPKTGAPRWKYTFAGVTYITDETSRCDTVPAHLFRCPSANFMWQPLQA